MNPAPDRLYELLPAHYRGRDAEIGEPLRALLKVIGEQVDVVEEDISKLYENWFVETCQDWVVPYIGDLVGYEPVQEAGSANNLLTPRREVANTVHYRRRKGALALLELLASDVAGWPARAVEFYDLLGRTQAINHPRPEQGRTVDLRWEDALSRLDGPFDELGHTVDARRIDSVRTRGRYNIPSVGLFVWRLMTYPVTQTPAYCREDVGDNCYTFSVLGNDAALYARPEPEAEPTSIAGEPNLPVPIRRRALEARKGALYGKSLQIWLGDSREPVAPDRIIPADLTGWHYEPGSGQVAVDPELGRIVFSPRQAPARVWVSYRYGSVADLGGGEYDRLLAQPIEDPPFDRDDLKDPVGLARKLRDSREPVSRHLWRQLSDEARQELDGGSDSEGLRGALVEVLNEALESESLYDLSWSRSSGLLSEPPQGRDRRRLNRMLLERAYPDELVKSFVLYRVGRGQDFDLIGSALARWREDRPRHAVVEIADSDVYVEQISVSMESGQTLQLRAANHARPVIRLLDWYTDLPDAFTVSGEAGSRFTLDGLLVTGRGIRVEGELSSVTIRHCTLVPGWSLEEDCEPRLPAEPSLQLVDTPHLCANVEHSIVGSIRSNQDEALTDPVRIVVADSVLDATGPERDALGAPGRRVAHARLTVARSTVFGVVRVHAVDLAENCIFDGEVKVARRGHGCVRFCYVTPGSRTPRRYNCQPDLAERAVQESLTGTALPAVLERERLRVRPRFDGVRYGTPVYCRLAEACAEEIKRGADDESEMGAFHRLFQPQREANLRVRLDEYTPAGMDAGIIFAS